MPSPSRLDFRDLVTDAEITRLRAIAAQFESERWNAWDRNIRCIPVLLNGSPSEMIGRLGGQEYDVEQFASAQTEAFDVRLRDRVVSKYVFEARLAFFRLAEKVWVILAVNPRYIYTHLTRRISRMPALCSPVFLSTRDFQRIFRALELEDHKLRVLQHSAYNAQESNIRFLRAERKVAPVFSELLEQSLVLRNITGAISDREDKRVLQFRITSSGAITLLLGSIGYIFQFAALAVAAVALEKEALLSDRQRDSDEFNPLSIKFDRSVLQDKAANHKLIHVLANTDKLGVGVYHANPYIHLILTDFRDGSRYTLYSAAEDLLQLVPSFQSSVASITRVHKAISEGFASCELANAELDRFILDDFFPEEELSR